VTVRGTGDCQTVGGVGSGGSVSARQRVVVGTTEQLQPVVLTTPVGGAAGSDGFGPPGQSCGKRNANGGTQTYSR